MLSFCFLSYIIPISYMKRRCYSLPYARSVISRLTVISPRHSAPLPGLMDGKDTFHPPSASCCSSKSSR